MRTESNKVVLVYPSPLPGQDQTSIIPLAVLAVASTIVDDFEVVILDERHHDDFPERLRAEAGDALCVGVSTITGYQLKGAIESSRLVKQVDSDIPVVWGGYHPSLFPEQAAREEYVDYVVRGQGEITFHELLQRIASDDDPGRVAGVTCVDADGNLVENPNRDIADLDTFPPLPYQLLDMERIFAIDGGERSIQYYSSQGCFFRCSFCVEPVVYRKWSARSATKMVAEIEDLVERFGVRHVSFADANFMAHRQRVDSFCDLMIEKQVPVTWSATARADKLAMEDVPFAQKLRQAGCIKMAIGIESGSWEILNLIDKRTTPDMALKSNQLMAGAGIEGAYAFMTGFPKQLPAARHEVRQTLGLIRRIRKDHPDILTIVFYLTPYPGTPIYDLVKQFLTRRPERIEDWASWEAVSGETEWLSEDEKDLVQRCNNFYFPLAYPNRQLRSRMGKAAWIPVVYPLHFLARLRCALGYYRFPFEWRLANFFSRIPFVRKAISQVTAIHGY